MAQVVGRSGAWSDIVRRARSRGHQLSQPEDLPTAIAVANRDFEQLQKNLQKTILQADLAVRDTEERRRRETGFVPLLANSVRVGIAKSKRHLTKSNVQRVERGRRASLAFLQQVPASREMAGAWAEHQVIMELEKLPDSYAVFNDVRLAAHKPIRSGGIAVRSAQLDHVVLSSRGVVVIETKNWSRAFGENEKFFNPFSQVERASLLLYVGIADTIGKTRVRSVIATSGWLPPRPRQSRTEVVPLQGLASHLQSMRGDGLSDRRVQQIHDLLLKATPT